MTAPTLAALAPAPTAATWLVVAVVLVVLAVVTVLCVLRARRLDRLHRRTDAARAGLADALERRGAAALRVADALERPDAGPAPAVVAAGAPRGPALAAGRGPGPVLPWRQEGGGAPGAPSDAAGLRAAARAALGACRTGMRSAGAGLEACEGAENTLTRRLAAVDRTALAPGLACELVDAEQLTLLARQVHNDAVRDTLDLRSRRLVRWLRLGGTAPAPDYFEIADPPRWSAAARPGPAAAGAGVAP